MTRLLDRLRWRSLDPAANLHLCGLVVLAAAAALVIEAVVLAARPAYVLAAAPTGLLALALVWAIARAEGSAIEAAIGRFADGVGLAIRPRAASLLGVWLYAAGLLAAVAAYGYLALTPSGVTRQDVIAQWGLQDKRIVVFGYLALMALAIFHYGMVRLFFAPPDVEWRANRNTPRRSPWARLAGAALVAVLAYLWIGAAALRDVAPAADGSALAPFYEYHSLVHLGALEQIRLGATPYLEARTQYGLGNQLLVYGVTQWLGFSNHGFYAAVLLIDMVCIVGFFVVVQQLLGLPWALAGLAGWALWPSPVGVLHVAGWAILTRWLVVPILALLLARRLLAAAPQPSGWIAAAAIGALWGLGGFMSQENLSGGLLVLLFSIGLYGPASGQPMAALLRFTGTFLVAGIAAYLVAVAATVGFTHSFDVLHMAAAQSSLVMAGVSNSVWSDNASLSLAIEILHGWFQDFLMIEGEPRPILQTYGFALLLMVVIGLVARFLGQRWRPGEARQASFAWKFAGVAVGAASLHLFALLRSDLSHLAGPSFLLPLLLLALPAFAWLCLRPGLGRGLLLLLSAVLIVDAVVVGRTDLARRIAAAGDAWSDGRAALAVYRTLQDAKDRPLDPAARYSPVPDLQAAFRRHPSFAELEELSRLLHDRLGGRPVELVLPTPDDPMGDPELLYFFGGFRSVSGITSPRGSLWLKRDEEDWIAKLLKAPTACVFFDTRSLGSRLYRAWTDATKGDAAVVTRPIVGRRDYGILSCRTARGS
ncbi:MAG: hypothetical protein FJX11_06805 [Alphaproteobacteria bacterium]|nr:hypothetical protein [Alphaproteobacteria bacterium]